MKYGWKPLDSWQPVKLDKGMATAMHSWAVSFFHILSLSSPPLPSKNILSLVQAQTEAQTETQAQVRVNRRKANASARNMRPNPPAAILSSSESAYGLSNPFPSKPLIVFSPQKPFYSQPNYSSWCYPLKIFLGTYFEQFSIRRCKQKQRSGWDDLYNPFIYPIFFSTIVAVLKNFFLLSLIFLSSFPVLFVWANKVWRNGVSAGWPGQRQGLRWSRGSLWYLLVISCVFLIVWRIWPNLGLLFGYQRPLKHLQVSLRRFCSSVLHRRDISFRHRGIIVRCKFITRTTSSNPSPCSIYTFTLL